LFLDQAPHVTDAFGALGLGLATSENIRWSARALRNRGAAVTFTNSIAITNVQERISTTQLRLKCM